MIDLLQQAFFAALGLLFTPTRDDIDRTCYADVLRFRHTAFFARLQVWTNVNHQAAMSDAILAVNGPEIHFQWQQEMQARRELWAMYALALEPPPDPNGDMTEPERILNSILDQGFCCSGRNYNTDLYTRLTFAQAFRGMLGEHLWEIGLMPDALPMYSVPVGPLHLKLKDD